MITPVSSQDPLAAEHCSVGDMAAYLDGRLEPAARRRLMAHLAVCATCRAEARDVRRMLRGQEHGKQRRGRWIMGAAAAALLLVVAGRFTPIGSRAATAERTPETTRLRPAADGEWQMAALNVVLDTVNGAGDRTARGTGLRLQWNADSLATVYEVAVYDERGGVMQQDRLQDTVWRLDMARLPRGARYFWSVDAHRRDGRVRSSGMQVLEWR